MNYNVHLWYHFVFLPSLCVANVDYKSGPYYAGFERGDTTATVSVIILDDKKIEEDEKFFICSLTISEELASNDSVVDPSAANTTITIRDNDGMQVTTVYIGLVV